MDVINAPEFSGNSYIPGINHFYFKNMSVEDGQYGKQFLFEFAPNLESDKVFKCWIPLQKEFETKKPENASFFKSKLRQYQNILANYLEDSSDIWQQTLVETFSTSFDETNKEALNDKEVQFVVSLLKNLPKDCTKLPISVILHYNKKGYLNIPSYKENSYKIPFGAAPVVGDKLNFEKPDTDENIGRSEAPTSTEADVETDIKFDILDQPTSDDLPF